LAAPRTVAGLAVRFQKLPHLAGQGHEREGLLDETGFATQQAAVDDGPVRVTGHEKHLHRPTARGQAGSQFAAAFPRHHHIRDQQMDRTFVRTSSSSSTSKIVSEPRAAFARGASVSAAAGWSIRGKYAFTDVPLPGSLYTCMPPPLCLTMLNTVVIPSPVPWPCALVVKKGSKRWARVSASIPEPLSPTPSATYLPGLMAMGMEG